MNIPGSLMCIVASFANIILFCKLIYTQFNFNICVYTDVEENVNLVWGQEGLREQLAPFRYPA